MSSTERRGEPHAAASATTLCITDTVHRAILFLLATAELIFGDFSTFLFPLFSVTSHTGMPPLSIFENSSSNFVSLPRLLPSLSSISGENDIIHHGMLSVFIFRNLPRQENGEGKDEERRSLRGRGILLLTLVSQLNPLASAINILIMMSDEPPRGRRSGSEEDEDTFG